MPALTPNTRPCRPSYSLQRHDSRYIARVPEATRHPTTHRAQVERTVQAHPQRVWDVLTDVAHADETLSGVTHVELLTEGPYGVGTRWRETRRMFGKETTEEMHVTAAEAPTRTVIEAGSRGVHYVTEFAVAPSDGDVTRLTMSFTAVQAAANPVQRTLGRLFGRLGAKAFEKVMAKDVEDIAARAERL
jgi:carbon monoxide dehydrogenase subunit G